MWKAKNITTLDTNLASDVLWCLGWADRVRNSLQIRYFLNSAWPRCSETRLNAKPENVSGNIKKRHNI